MKNLSDQKKGSLLAFIAVMFITPDSLFIRLSNVDTWGLVFYSFVLGCWGKKFLLSGGRPYKFVDTEIVSRPGSAQ